MCSLVTLEEKMEKSLGGMRVVQYRALVPLGYDARHSQLTALHIRDPKKGGLVVLSSEMADIIAETSSQADSFPDHVCTNTGRWIPKKFIIKNPEPDRLLIVNVRPGSKLVNKTKPKK